MLQRSSLNRPNVSISPSFHVRPLLALILLFHSFHFLHLLVRPLSSTRPSSAFTQHRRAEVGTSMFEQQLHWSLSGLLGNGPPAIPPLFCFFALRLSTPYPVSQHIPSIHCLVTTTNRTANLILFLFLNHLTDKICLCFQQYFTFTFVTCCFADLFSFFLFF